MRYKYDQKEECKELSDKGGQWISKAPPLDISAQEGSKLTLLHLVVTDWIMHVQGTEVFSFTKLSRLQCVFYFEIN